MSSIRCAPVASSRADRLRAAADHWLVDSPVNLAVFRITVFAVLLGSAELYDAPRTAALAASLRLAPFGIGWLASWVPISEALARGVQWVVWAACVAGMIGFRAQAAALVACVGSAYLLGVPQLTGTVIHNHHLVWFAALLAASPCGDALGLDARRKTVPSSSSAYGIPLRAAWLTIGLIFFFPGIWKLIESGWEWTSPEALRAQMAWKAAQWGRAVPAVDSALLRAGATGVLVFELAAPALFLFKRTRYLGVVLALLFHAAAQILLGIVFSSLWACYTVFVDWTALRRRAPETSGAVPALPPGRSRLAAGVAAVILLGQLATGLTGIEQAWPFATYPTFRFAAGSRMSALFADAILDDDSVVAVDALEPGRASQRTWGTAWSLRGADEAALRALFEDLARNHPQARWAGARRVRFYRGVIKIPAESAPRAERGRVLAEIER